MIDWLKRVSMDRLISPIDTINSVQIVMRIDMALWMYPCIPQRDGPKCHDKTHLDCLPFHFVPSDDYYLSRVFRRNVYNFKRYSIPTWTMAQWDKETAAAAAHPNINDEHTISSFRYDDSFRQFFTIIYFYLFFARFFWLFICFPFLKWLSHSILCHAKLQIMTMFSSVCLYPFQTFWFWFTFYIEKANDTSRPSTTSIWGNGYVHLKQGVLLYLWRNLLSINIDVLSAKWYWQYVIVATNIWID